MGMGEGCWVPCPGTEIPLPAARNWSETPLIGMEVTQILKVIVDSLFLGKWELQMFGDSWDSCTAGIVQLFGEFCGISQLGLVFPNLSVHPALSVGSSWAHIISALRNNPGWGGNLEG